MEFKYLGLEIIECGETDVIEFEFQVEHENNSKAIAFISEISMWLLKHETGYSVDVVDECEGFLWYHIKTNCIKEYKNRNFLNEMINAIK